jgi:hypothetical protein
VGVSTRRLGCKLPCIVAIYRTIRIYICTFFNIIDRIAEALNFHVLSAEMFAYRASLTLNHGYQFSSMTSSST